MNSEQLLNKMMGMLQDIERNQQINIQQLQISNLLAISTNIEVPEDIRKAALNKSLEIMNLKPKSQELENLQSNVL